jgi:hypothetical protein
VRRPEPKAQVGFSFIEPASPAATRDAADQARAQDLFHAVAHEIVRQLGGVTRLPTHNCIRCNRFAFPTPRLCFWCRPPGALADGTAVDAAGNNR